MAFNLLYIYIILELAKTKSPKILFLAKTKQ